VEARLDALATAGKNHWANYPLGVADALQSSGKRLRGMNVLVSGDVPLGAGLSSSASIEVAAGFAMLRLSGVEFTREELAQLCQRAENEFVGARVGIMDQFVSCLGQTGHALLLDCRSLDYELYKLPKGIQLVICNTKVKHAIASGEYNRRRAECEEGVRALRMVLPEVRALRDVSISQLERHCALLDPKVYSRCRHVVTENDRTQKAARALCNNDLRTLGRLMRESHRSLRDDYEVSCKELDEMVEIASAQRGVIGARMTGGGFGGCTINLVETGAVESFRKNIAAEYETRTGLRPDTYVSPASDGVQQVEVGSDRVSS